MQQDGVMAKEMFKNLRQKLMGAERNQRQALQDAGCAGEGDAAARAQSIIGQSVEESTQFMNLRKLRQAKPELTLKTATFILDRTKLLGRLRQPLMWVVSGVKTLLCSLVVQHVLVAGCSCHFQKLTARSSEGVFKTDAEDLYPSGHSSL